MKVIEVSGSPREIGCLTGAALREEIREHLSLFPPNIDKAVWAQRFPRFLETLKTYLPSVLTQKWKERQPVLISPSTPFSN